jgi:serine/threonine-protein kinase
VGADAGGTGPNLLRVSSTLVVASAGWPTIHEKTYEDEVSDIDDLQSNLLADIGELLGRTPAGQRTRTVQTPKDYILGRFFADKLTEAALHRAVEHYESAIREAPDFAPAHAGRSEALAILQGNHRAFTTTEALSWALDSAKTAISLDNASSEGHAALAWANFYLAWDWPAAEAAFNRALALDPTNAVAHHLFADFLSVLGRHAEALEHQHLAIKSDPASLRFNRGLGWIDFFMGDFPAAAKALEATLGLESSYTHARSLLARTYAQLGRHDEALAQMLQVWKVEPTTSHDEMLGQLHAIAGRRAAAMEVVTRLESRTALEGGYVRPYFIALIYAALGERRQALERLERAYLEHDSTIVHIATDPRFRELRGDPRFDALCRRLRLRFAQ